MEALLPQTLRLFIGADTPAVASIDDVGSDILCGAICMIAPRREIVQRAAAKGYKYFYSFVVLPSSDAPRWLVPAGHLAAAATTHLYRPHRLAARVAKRVVVGALSLGWEGWPTCRVVVASRTEAQLQRLVREVTGEDHLVLSFSLGRQAAVRKLTVQVTRPDGAPVGFMKVGLGDVAIERVRREAANLERLSHFADLRPHVPRVLYSGVWNDTHVLFQSALQGHSGPMRFGTVHAKFLSILENVHRLEVSGRALLAPAVTLWESTCKHLSSEWHELGRTVLQQGNDVLSRSSVSCGITHGDFAPWNTRVRQGDLLLFDWESATWNTPPIWDAFHFQVHTAYLYRNDQRFKLPRRDRFDEICYMLYLLRAVCQYVEEHNEVAVQRYKELLLRVLTGQQLWTPWPAVSG